MWINLNSISNFYDISNHIFYNGCNYSSILGLKLITVALFGKYELRTEMGKGASERLPYHNIRGVEQSPTYGIEGNFSDEKAITATAFPSARIRCYQLQMRLLYMRSHVTMRRSSWTTFPSEWRVQYLERINHIADSLLLKPCIISESSDRECHCTSWPDNLKCYHPKILYLTKGKLCIHASNTNCSWRSW